jgi:hypothetical protein
MTTTIENGRRRPSLSEQIDRLDSILDGLAEALNEAVTMAVKEAVSVAVKEAVQAVMAEVLANADVLARLRGIASSPAHGGAPKPNALKRFLGRVRDCAASGLRVCASAPRRIGSLLTAAWSGLGELRQFKVPLLTAVGVGTAVGTGAYFAGPYLAALAGWIAGFSTTLFLQLGLWLRRKANGVFGFGRRAPCSFAEEVTIG